MTDPEVLRLMTMRWFGRDLGAPIYQECPQAQPPVGWPCSHCAEEIAAADDGIIDAGGAVFHRACFLRGIFGSILHQLRQCSCYQPGVRDSTPEELGISVREEAELAVAYFEARVKRKESNAETN